MSLQQTSQILDGALHGNDVMFDSVSTDTRSLQKGALYFALKGDRFDGHDYLQQAQQSGAVAAVVSEYKELDLPQIQVVDTRKALGRLAAAWRQKFQGTVIGVTGSNGKTTVKEMIAAILAERGEVLATLGNFNNDIGLPLTLLRMESALMANKNNYAVIEMGANHQGEIFELTQITRPDVAVITNAGPAHLEGFGSVKKVAKAKGEIYSGLTDAGVAIINADDKYFDYWQSLCDSRKISSFGLNNEQADVKGKWQPTTTGGKLSIHTAQGECKINLSVPGRHNAMNALAACAASLAAGASIENIQTALANFSAVKGRLNICKAACDAEIIDDTYNANPASLKAGLEVLSDMPGERWLILGDMGELGENSERLHFDVGVKASESGVNRLLATGPNSKSAVKAFGEYGQHFETQDELITFLQQHLHADMSVLVKGSRFMQMDKVVAAIVENKQKGSA
ncbi:MAG: UDP-N-acetylmuramoyl-tripeptide--D-alanyl-D-alanine ligase [Gammaproteobacteria bacterium]|nr:UDP-N-acetylmuramoyl-tripeptide--D-alanyl-D-alanine ligase [Gammaproteobacteria bacterium]